MRFFSFLLFISSLLTGLVTSVAWSQSAAPVLAGPYAVGTGEYKFAPQVISDILTDRKTEIWARVFWPKDKVTGTIPKAFPLIAFLHGNHGTCGIGVKPRQDYNSDYTETGICPKGYVVTPNHDGYNYIAEQLASYGYVVFSINANRGITAGGGISGDSGLNLARGKLILKHFELWSQWANGTTSAPISLNGNKDIFLNKIDFSHVGMMGHSRGGEGVRAAYNLYYDVASSWPARIPQLNFEAIFEIGAVDGQTSRVLDAQNVVWNQLIPICDGDVSNFVGISPFNRMMESAKVTDSAQKSVYYVYGANHNFFNTEWQTSDSYGCAQHDPLWKNGDWESQKQQTIAKKIMVDFFRMYVNPIELFKLQDIFNPLSTVDTMISSLTAIERDFSVNPNTNTQLRFDDFNTGAVDVTRVPAPNVKGVVEPGSLDLKSQLAVTWVRSAASDVPTLKLVKSSAVDVSKMKTLDFRFSLLANHTDTKALNLTVKLVDEKGTVSNSISLLDYVQKVFNPFYGALFQTVRIPLHKFSGIDFTHLKSVEFEFLEPEQNKIYLAHVRFSSRNSWGIMQIQHPRFPQNARGSYEIKVLRGAAGGDQEVNEISDVEMISPDQVAIKFSSTKQFKIQNSLPILKIGEKTFDISRIKNTVYSSTITFYMSVRDFRSISAMNMPLKITYRENLDDSWMFENTLAQTAF